MTGKVFNSQAEAGHYPEYCVHDVCCGFYRKKNFLTVLVPLVLISLCLLLFAHFLITIAFSKRVSIATTSREINPKKRKSSSKRDEESSLSEKRLSNGVERRRSYRKLSPSRNVTSSGIVETLAEDNLSEKSDLSMKERNLNKELYSQPEKELKTSNADIDEEQLPLLKGEPSEDDVAQSVKEEQSPTDITKQSEERRDKNDTLLQENKSTVNGSNEHLKTDSSKNDQTTFATEPSHDGKEGLEEKSNNIECTNPSAPKKPSSQEAENMRNITLPLENYKHNREATGEEKTLVPSNKTILPETTENLPENDGHKDDVNILNNPKPNKETGQHISDEPSDIPLEKVETKDNTGSEKKHSKLSEVETLSIINNVPKENVGSLFNVDSRIRPLLGKKEKDSIEEKQDEKVLGKRLSIVGGPDVKSNEDSSTYDHENIVGGSKNNKDENGKKDQPLELEKETPKENRSNREQNADTLKESPTEENQNNDSAYLMNPPENEEHKDDVHIFNNPKPNKETGQHISDEPSDIPLEKVDIKDNTGPEKKHSKLSEVETLSFTNNVPKESVESLFNVDPRVRPLLGKKVEDSIEEKQDEKVQQNANTPLVPKESPTEENENNDSEDLYPQENIQNGNNNIKTLEKSSFYEHKGLEEGHEHSEEELPKVENDLPVKEGGQFTMHSLGGEEDKTESEEKSSQPESDSKQTNSKEISTERQSENEENIKEIGGSSNSELKPENKETVDNLSNGTITPIDEAVPENTFSQGKGLPENENK